MKLLSFLKCWILLTFLDLRYFQFYKIYSWIFTFFFSNFWSIYLPKVEFRFFCVIHTSDNCASADKAWSMRRFPSNKNWFSRRRYFFWWSDFSCFMRVADNKWIYIFISSETGAWSEPITSGNIYALFNLGLRIWDIQK